jgi:hypothetical protein
MDLTNSVHMLAQGDGVLLHYEFLNRSNVAYVAAFPLSRVFYVACSAATG